MGVGTGRETRLSGEFLKHGRRCMYVTCMSDNGERGGGGIWTMAA